VSIAPSDVQQFSGPIEQSRRWAENPQDVPVKPGMYSALHWAAKAMEGATGAFDAPNASPLIRGLVPAGRQPGQSYVPAVIEGLEGRRQ